MTEWKPIDTAPKGGGAERVTDPKWVEPPTLLLDTPEGVVIGSWDHYYGPSGAGYKGCSAWTFMGYLIAQEFGEPSFWMPLPKSLLRQKKGIE